MDSLTQIVLGAAVAEAVIGNRVGNRAMLYGGILGTIPDLDVFVGKLFDPITALEIHRGISHSIVFGAALAPIFGLLIARLERKSNLHWGKAMWAAFLCLVTHGFLDAFTTWGTQLFWPHPFRAGVQSIFVIDPLYTIPFLLCVIAAMRKPKGSDSRRSWNRAGIVISSCYLFFTVIVKQVTTDVFETSLATKDINYDRLIVKPSPFNIILWNANVATADGYWLGDFSWFDSEPIHYRFYPHGKQYLAPYAENETIRQLIRISEGWYVVTKKDGTLYFNDLRFGLLNDDPKNPQFTFSYKVSETDGQLTATEVEKSPRDGKAMLKKMANRIAGNR